MAAPALTTPTASRPGTPEPPVAATSVATTSVADTSANTAPTAVAGHLSEVLAALSYALDLTGGQAPGHTLRTCLIALRLADELGLGNEDREALYYAVLLKDAGCSSNAARMAALFAADDRLVKPRMKVADWHRRLRMTVETARNVAPGAPLLYRARRLVAIARDDGVAREVILIRCERGAQISRSLGFPEATAAAIRSLDEHWCGRGHPDGLRGDAIPLLSRILLLAQTMEAYLSEHGLDAAIRVIRARRGRWFDPRVADVALGWRRDTGWWDTLHGPDTLPVVIRSGPAAVDGAAQLADEASLDMVARAFADIIDAKSPFTFRHSVRVAALARGAAGMLGLPRQERRHLHRAGLLHDIGKLGVSNLILDKPGRLEPGERAAVERHPAYTLEILQRVGAFRELAWLAALHHEKLDGSGYPWGVRGVELDAPARLLAVADIYEALTADRPYRAGMSHARAMAILEGERDTRLCGQAIDALAAYVDGDPEG